MRAIDTLRFCLAFGTYLFIFYLMGLIDLKLPQPLEMALSWILVFGIPLLANYLIALRLPILVRQDAVARHAWSALIGLVLAAVSAFVLLVWVMVAFGGGFTN